ncbi:hypothetical protein MHN28_22925, partial [Ruegeria sp. Ofav3-42]|nr:hypothetical protein [Ruegeria sp. Ofav3-42]
VGQPNANGICRENEHGQTGRVRPSNRTQGLSEGWRKLGAQVTFAAAAGAFWEPMATECSAPVHLFHVHGFKDRMVLFEGRQLTWEGVDFHQGNVMKGVDVWRRENACLGSAENSIADDNSMQKDWRNCSAGSIRLKVTKGGHGVPEGWRNAVLDWFEALPRALDCPQSLRLF